MTPEDLTAEVKRLMGTYHGEWPADAEIRQAATKVALGMFRGLIREFDVRRDREKTLARDKLTTACMAGQWSMKARFPGMAIEPLLDWLDQATEADVEWLYDPHGEPR